MKNKNKNVSNPIKSINCENKDNTNNFKNENLNTSHNTKKESLGPNTKR